MMAFKCLLVIIKLFVLILPSSSRSLIKISGNAGKLESLRRVNCNDIQAIRNFDNKDHYMCELEFIKRPFSPVKLLCPPYFEQREGKCVHLSQLSENSDETYVKCKKGFVFNRRKKSCVKKTVSKEQFEVRSDEIALQPMMYCEGNTVFVPDLNMCVPVTESTFEGKPQKAEPLVSFLSSQFSRCPPGEIYSSELDLCLTIPFHPSFLSETDSLIQDKDTTELEDEKKTKFVGRCPNGMIYSSKMGRCTSLNNERPISDDQSVYLQSNAPHTTTSKPFPLTFGPSDPDKIGPNKCEDGTVYVSEIDLCMPVNPPK